MTDDGGKLGCSAELLALMPESLAREYCLFPLKCERGVLTVAVAAPLSAEDLNRVEFVLGREIHEINYPAEAIRGALDGHFGEGVIEDSEPRAYYWRPGRKDLDGGSIVIKTSWYCGTTHMTGWTEIAPDHLDFGLWSWIIAEGDRFEKVISGDDLDVIREGYKRHLPLDARLDTTPKPL